MLHTQKKLQVNRTKIKGGCQWETKAAHQNSCIDFTLVKGWFQSVCNNMLLKLIYHVLLRIITNAEEIAFYGGHEIEKTNLQRAYKSLTKQSVSIFNQKLWYVQLEQFLMKYGWAGTGMITMAIPIFTSHEKGASIGDNIAGRG